jgi:hypothetical protein
MAFVVAASVVFVGLISVLITLARRFAAPPPIPLTAERFDELSTDVANFVRLLDDEEFHSFYSQDGSTPRIAYKLAIQRWKLMHEHLRHLKSGFKLICMALKVIIVESKQDRPDLAWALLRNQMTFAYGMTVIRFQLACFVCGILVFVVLCQVRKVLWRLE